MAKTSQSERGKRMMSLRRMTSPTFPSFRLSSFSALRSNRPRITPARRDRRHITKPRQGQGGEGRGGDEREGKGRGGEYRGGEGREVRGGWVGGVRREKRRREKE